MKTTKLFYGIALALTFGLAAMLKAQDIYVVNGGNNTIGEYTIAGSTVHASLISGVDDPEGIAISGNDLFVLNYGDGTVGEYTTSGATVNASLISGLSSPGGIGILGSDLFVVNQSTDAVGEYTTAGGTVNASLISGLDIPVDLAISPAPEPSACALASLGMAALWRRRK